MFQVVFSRYLLADDVAGLLDETDPDGKTNQESSDEIYSGIPYLFGDRVIDTMKKKTKKYDLLYESDDIDYNLADLFDEKKEEDTPPHHDPAELNMNDLFFANDTIPFSDVAGRLAYYLSNDIKHLEADLGQWIPLSFDAIVEEHRVRAEVFLTCCYPIRIMNGDRLKSYVDSYGLLEEQSKIIADCIKTLSGKEEINCKNGIHKLNITRQNTINFTNNFADKSILTSIDSSIKQQIYIDNIVYNYHLSTNDRCPPALLLLWKPDLLIQCEIFYRTRLTAKSASISDYEIFSDDISKPFRQMVSNIFVNLKVTSDKIKHILFPLNKSVPKDQINHDVTSIKNKIDHYKILNVNPMIAHYEKRAHTYKMCCEKLENDDLINQYLLSYNNDFIKMDKLLRSCINGQILTGITNDTFYGGECQKAYNDLTDAMNKRQDYIKQYKEQAKDINEKYRQTTTSKLSQAWLIKSMNSFVKIYCEDQHVFELMFSPEKLVKCEEFIRKSIGENGSQIYLDYDKSISVPFQNMVLSDWQALEKVQASNPPISSERLSHTTVYQTKVKFDEIYILQRILFLLKKLMLGNIKSRKNISHRHPLLSLKRNTASTTSTYHNCIILIVTIIKLSYF
ncbi:unnamed protein product [Rotaria socialis]|uniref:Uncharacterized protein n=1 Tax=Rotaria socialis TaxID=392032 RepID=A0A817UYX1_9BILA|nr:unnamed protein product [Rotaria socialis]